MIGVCGVGLICNTAVCKRDKAVKRLACWIPAARSGVLQGVGYVCLFYLEGASRLGGRYLSPLFFTFAPEGPFLFYICTARYNIGVKVRDASFYISLPSCFLCRSMDVVARKLCLFVWLPTRGRRSPMAIILELRLFVCS